jgi:hypothetical protein
MDNENDDSTKSNSLSKKPLMLSHVDADMGVSVYASGSP